MVDTIEKALRPFSLVAFFIGFGILKYPLNYWKFRLSVFYILILWSFYAFAFQFVIGLFNPKYIFNNFFVFMILKVNIVITIISVTISIRKYQKIHTCIKKLGFVDDTLEKLGTPKQYDKIQHLILRTLIIYLVTILILFFADSMWYIEKFNTVKAMIIPLVLKYPYHVNTLGDIMFASVLRYIGTRLDKINDYMEQLSETEEYGLRCKWKKSVVIRRYVQSEEDRKHMLWTVMHLHSELCRLARDINDLFGTQLTLQMISYFIILIISFYVQYHMMVCLKQMHGSNSAKIKLIFANDMWCTMFLTKFVSVNLICASVSSKVQKTKDITHKLTNLIRFTETRREIYQFLLQISLRPLEFVGMGMFHFGYKFIYKFVIWILTVTIFIIQMDTYPIFQTSGRINETCFDRDV